MFHFWFIYGLVITFAFAREIPSPPYITKQPPTDEVLFHVESNGENDKPFYIECEASGEPAPTYEWMKNGMPFKWQAYDDRISQQPGRGTLSITRPRDEDLGQYQCFAKNEYGIATSNSVFMRKAELNSFKTQSPLTLVGEEGKPFKLECNPPDGWPKPVVHWIYLYTAGGFKTINSSRLTLDPEGNLWFSNLTKADRTDNFMYACAAASPSKYEYKYGNRVLLDIISSTASASLNKFAPRMQYVTKKQEVALRGKKAELYCIFGGTPLPQTVWKKNGVTLQTSDRITQGNYGKSLIIKVVDFEDEGSYTCEVSNGVGEAKSYSINLQVLSAPYFTLEPERVNAAEGETVEFKCEASGSPEPEIKWIYNGKPLDKAPNNPRRRQYRTRLIIENLEKKDTANYGCNATNSLGYVYKDVYVNVLALAPEITEAPSNVEAVDNQNINLTCRVMGAPKPIIKWIHNGQELTGGRFSVLENGNLFISMVQHDDKGNYTCYAENKFGNTSANGRLDVKEHTYITDGPEDYEVEAGTPATFRCNAVADESLDLEIQWLKNDQPIDFDGEPRFVRTSDYSLTITKTDELDSGSYTCLAKTRLDEASAKAQLTVQAVPNKPELKGIHCHSKDATIDWISLGDNRTPILHFIIQYNTSFTPDSWEDIYSKVPATDFSYNVPLSPWANYTFRVIAENKIGRSPPSDHSEVCNTPPEVPHKNPDNVKGEGDRPNNMVISWTRMPEIEHNAPRFQYKVFWKRDIPGHNYTVLDIMDWRQDKYVVENQPSYKPYKIKVIAMNELGEANVSPREYTGWSGESEPEQAPTNFTLLQIESPTQALLSWNPVDLSSVKGKFIGYKVKSWSDASPISNEIQVAGESNRALITTLVPYTMNHAQVYVHNGKYNGPPSSILSFRTPEGVPGQMDTLEAIPLGSSAFMLYWEPPERPNGILTGYNIYYAKIKPNMKVDPPVPRKPQILDPTVKRAKLPRLEPGTKYRIFIAATTSQGESERLYIERETKPPGSVIPSKPDFETETIKDGITAAVRVHWKPNRDGKTGTHFYVRYRKKGEPTYRQTAEEFVEGFQLVTGLETGETYEFILVAVDGNHHIASDPQEVVTSDVGPMIVPKENVATAGWFIGMILAVTFLLAIIIIVCIIRRNRGGKYAVHEREQANGRHDYPDEGGFHEYSQPLDNKSHSRASMNSEPKMGPDDDSDSMAEYGDGDTEGMNEDGSFIGQYGRKKGQGETTSQGFATLV